MMDEWGCDEDWSEFVYLIVGDRKDERNGEYENR